jgi:hypothetical protein
MELEQNREEVGEASKNHWSGRSQLMWALFSKCHGKVT